MFENSALYDSRIQGLSNENQKLLHEIQKFKHAQTVSSGIKVIFFSIILHPNLNNKLFLLEFLLSVNSNSLILFVLYIFDFFVITLLSFNLFVISFFTSLSLISLS